MRLATTTLLALALMLVGFNSTSLAQGSGEFGMITHRNTPLKSGSGIPDAQIGKLAVGQPVKVLGYDGEFAKVALPGGVDCYILEKRGPRKFVEIDASGRARVIVDRLTVRPHANSDWPAMGMLKANESIMVFERVDKEWLRIMIPDRLPVFVHKAYVRIAADQSDAAAQYARLDMAAREMRLKGGKLSSTSQVIIKQDDALQQRYDAAAAKMNTSLRSQPNLESLVSLRSEFESIQAAAPKDSNINRAAGEKVAYIQGKEDMARRFAAADSKIRGLDEARQRRESEYQNNLKRFRTKKEQAKMEDNSSTSRFLDLGIGNLHKIYLGVGNTPTWVLSKGAESRYYVSSARYDLSEYHDKKIGITKWRHDGQVPGSQYSRVEILRLEILD